MYVCRGRRVLDDETYAKVYEAVADGRISDALLLLRGEAEVDLSDPEAAARRVLEIADRRVGCGQDLTSIIVQAPVGDHEAVCPRCGLLFRWSVQERG